MKNDIDNHRPVLDNVNKSAVQLIQTSEPKVAQLIQERLDEVNRRFGNVDTNSSACGKTINDMTDKLSEFEKEVNSLEDWELPVLQSVESATFMRGDLTEIAGKLKVRLSRGRFIKTSL